MLVGKYRLLRVIGDGSFSTVKLGVHVFTNETVAVKIIQKSSLTDQSQYDRLQERIATVQRLDHPGVIKLIEVIEDETAFYVVLEYCGGGELFDFIISRQRVEEPLAKRFFKQIVLAVGYCHSQNVIHRDLKPENLLLTEYNTVKLIDFGLCNTHADQPLHDRCGSSCYIAPEALTTTSYYGILADVWALGVILYALVDGSLPWNYQDPDQMFQQITTGTFPMPKNISLECQDMIRGILNPDVSQRFTIDAILVHPWLFGVGNVFPLPKPAGQQVSFEPHLTLNLGGFSQQDIRPEFEFPQAMSASPNINNVSNSMQTISEAGSLSGPMQPENHMGLNMGMNMNMCMNMNMNMGQGPGLMMFGQNQPMQFQPPPQPSPPPMQFANLNLNGMNFGLGNLNLGGLNNGFGNFGGLKMRTARSSRSKPIQPRSISLDAQAMAENEAEGENTSTHHGPIMSQTISHDDPSVVAQQLEQTLVQLGINFQRTEPLMFHLYGQDLQVSAEVCKLYGFRNVYVVAFKRIQGDSWQYTQFVSAILDVFKH